MCNIELVFPLLVVSCSLNASLVSVYLLIQLCMTMIGNIYSAACDYKEIVVVRRTVQMFKLCRV